MPECIIDIHTHIYPSVLARRAMKVAGREHDAYENLPVKENLLSRMQEEGICLSIVQPVVSKPETQRDVNRFARGQEAGNYIFRRAPSGLCACGGGA